MLNAYEDGTARKFQNIGANSSDAGRLPRKTRYGIQHIAKVWKRVENIQKEHLERDRVVLYVTDNIIVHMNPDGDSGGGDGERENSDTEDRSDCLSSEDMD